MKACVFAVNDTYHIMVYVETPSLMWVKVGEQTYYDESNGILRSQSRVHRMVVPQMELDRAEAYTICERKIIERKPYFTESEDVREYEYTFYPVKSVNPRAYQVADAHNLTAEPIAAAKLYGEIDFLILNGDIPNDSGTVENFEAIYTIASGITKGEKPIVFSRGNHDLRGVCAENLAEYTPSNQGKTYYTFRLGTVWGIVLDCGEDKEDSHSEYGHTVCCHELRKRQTDFLKEIIKNAKSEYLQEGIQTRLVIVHNPFTEQLESPFNIEEDIYREWARMLREFVKPHVMLCGHLHRLQISYPGDSHDHLGNPSPVIVGSNVNVKERLYTGVGVEFGKEKITATFTSSTGEIVEQSILKR